MQYTCVLFHSWNRDISLIRTLFVPMQYTCVLFHSWNRDISLIRTLFVPMQYTCVLFHSWNRDISLIRTLFAGPKHVRILGFHCIGAFSWGTAGEFSTLVHPLTIRMHYTAAILTCHDQNAYPRHRPIAHPLLALMFSVLSIRPLHGPGAQCFCPCSGWWPWGWLLGFCFSGRNVLVVPGALALLGG